MIKLNQYQLAFEIVYLHDPEIALAIAMMENVKTYFYLITKIYYFAYLLHDNLLT